MADRERVDMAALSKLISDIENFNLVMDMLTNDMLSGACEIQSVWNDDQYRQFLGFMIEIATGLKSDLSLMRETEEKLVTIRKILMEE